MGFEGCTHKGDFAAVEYQPFIADGTEFGAVPQIRKFTIPVDMLGRCR